MVSHPWLYRDLFSELAIYLYFNALHVSQYIYTFIPHISIYIKLHSALHIFSIKYTFIPRMYYPYYIYTFSTNVHWKCKNSSHSQFASISFRKILSCQYVKFLHMLIILYVKFHSAGLTKFPNIRNETILFGSQTSQE